VRDVLIWTTALALICGLVRWAGIPWEEWSQSHYRSWVPLFSGGVVLSVTLVLALWAALGTGSARARCLLLVVIPALAIASALIDWLAVLPSWRPWTAPWYNTLTWAKWFYWIFWRPFSESTRFTAAWLSLAGGMLFATLLFPRALGYRLVREGNVLPKKDETIAVAQAAGARR